MSSPATRAQGTRYATAHCGSAVHARFQRLRQIAILTWIPSFPSAEHESVRSASRQLVEVLHAATFTRWQSLTGLYLPSARSSIATGVHLALIYAWVTGIGSEYFMTIGPGIGGLIIAGRERFEMDLVMLGILILGLVKANHPLQRLVSVRNDQLWTGWHRI